MERQRERRARLFGLAEDMGLALAATGTHPWADYLDQRIIDTPHYARLREELRWVAQRNNTWSLHVHVGVRGRGPGDRRVRSPARRAARPARGLGQLAVPGRRDTGLHSVRTEIFTRVFPRCGVHEPFGTWDAYADFVELLVRTGSIVEATQLWWSVRPHHAFGTVELRICDAQTRGEESFALAALITACIAQAAIDYDDGRLRRADAPARDRGEPLAGDPSRDGRQADRLRPRRGGAGAGRGRAARGVDGAGRAMLGLEVAIPSANGAQRAEAALAEGATIEEIYRGAVEETRRTYAPQRVNC